jgi:uncharacterized protein (DUF1330 family)
MISDQALFDTYRKEVPETISAFGGRFIVRDGSTVLKSEWPTRMAVIEFPSRAAVRNWYNSADYKKLATLRQRSSTSNIIIVDAVA